MATSSPSRRVAFLRSLGAQPGPYVVTAAAIAVVAFSFHVWRGAGDPLTLRIAASGLTGALYGLIPLVLDLVPRRAPIGGVADQPGPGWSPDRRRGAVVGLGIGVPLFGGLLGLSLATGQTPLYPVSFAVIVIGIVAAAAWNLRRTPSVADDRR